jgi:hypothetical protein
VASGAYINRMSNHCKGCRYDVGKPHGADACPFNALYWSFLARHRDELAGNPRMAQMYRTWDKLSADRRAQTLASADAFLAKLDDAGKPAAPAGVAARLSPQTADVEDRGISGMILKLCAERGPARTVCPSEVARALAIGEDSWRALMPEIRRIAARLAAKGRIVVTQRGKTVDATCARGAIRLSLATATQARKHK